MILDIGCGHRPKGDVNLDLTIKASGHRGINDTNLNLKKIPNFIIGDIHNLPFKDNSFNKTFSYHVIEHTKRCFRMLKEMVRVSSNKVEVFCPHKFDIGNREERNWQRKHHPSQLTRRWFNKASKLLNLKVVINECDRFRGFPHIYCGLLRLPIEIHFLGEKIK